MDSKDVGGRGGRGVGPVVNVTPLIDILLVLLIIFMVITPLRPARFKALVPEPPPDDPKVNKSPRTLVVEIDAGLNLRLVRGGTPLAEGSLDDAAPVASGLAREWAERKAAGEWTPGMADRADLPPDRRIERTVFIRAPRSIGYGQVARLIDRVKGAGAQPIGLQTDELPK